MSEQRLWDSLRVHGFELVRQRKHRVYKNPLGQTFVVASTPSDRRWSANALADLARLCGTTETDWRPLRARRQHSRLERVVEPPSMEALQLPQPPAELILAPAPVPALSRADRQRLKRWEKHESQRGAKVERRLAKLRDLAHRAHNLLGKGGGDRALHIVALTMETQDRVRQLGFRNVALSMAEATLGDRRSGLAVYVRVGGRFLDILAGVVREGPTWKDGDYTVEVWGDIQPGDFEELEDEPLYLGPGYVDPSQFRLELKIQDGKVLELALFEALLSYAEGMPALVVLNKSFILHGAETLDLVAAGGSAIEGKHAKIIHLKGDAGDKDEIVDALDEDACDWDELLESGRRTFMDGAQCSESYVAWLKQEIAKRVGDGKTAAA